MSVKLIPEDAVPEDQLRAALRPHRVNPEAFEAAVRERLNVAESVERERRDSPLARLSPLRQCVAALLPLPLITGGKITGPAANVTPATGVYKLLSYLALPVISLFMLLGTAVFCVMKIRRIQTANEPRLMDKQAMEEATTKWWRSHRWGASLAFALIIALILIGSPWLLLVFYIISFGLVLLVLHSLIRLGLGNRIIVGQFCVTGLMPLAQVSVSMAFLSGEPHILNQSLACIVILGGAIAIIGITSSSPLSPGPLRKRDRRILLGVLLMFFIAFAVGQLRGGLFIRGRQPATPAQIKSYVESFKSARFSSASWRNWEIVASWAVETKLNPDLSGAQKLLDKEIAAEKNPFMLAYTLGSAFRVGLVGTDQIDPLNDHYERMRRLLLDDQFHILEKQPILGLESEDWLIRASVLRNALTPEQRNYLERRLLLALARTKTDPYAVLDTPLRVTQLLEVIGRPIDRDRYRDSIHDLLRRFHYTVSKEFQVAGGFRPYLNVDASDDVATSNAVRLMEIYGIPKGLDTNSIRSFLQSRLIYDDWIAEVTLKRLNRLSPLVVPPRTWLEVLYIERTLLAAMILVGLCLYATLSSPLPAPASVASRFPKRGEVEHQFDRLNNAATPEERARILDEMTRPPSAAKPDPREGTIE